MYMLYITTEPMIFTYTCIFHISLTLYKPLSPSSLTIFVKACVNPRYLGRSLDTTPSSTICKYNTIYIQH